MSSRSYADAGVDIDLEATAITSLIKNLTFRRTGSPRMTGKVGHYAGLLEFGDYVLALTTDGVGTKMLVADMMQDWTTVGIDCVAMNVNDLYVMNLEPVAFVDYIATDRLSVEKMAQIGIGLNEGARQSNIDIVGGETATLRGLVNGLDLAGTCLVGRKVGGREVDRGILIGGTGLGMCIVANKIPGVRAAPCHDDMTAEMSRRHNDLNVLCLSGDMLGERLTDRLVEIWIKTPFEGGRHARRNQKIAALESRNGKP